MRRIFVTTKEFDKLWKSLGNSDRELRILENELIYDTLKGKVINGTEGLRKLRWQIKGKGKRGGIRILYVDFPKFNILFFISLIKKNEKDNISQNDKKLINIFINNIQNEIKKIHEKLKN